MKNNRFVADGFSRFLRGKKNAQSEPIKTKYAVQLANASLGEKREIHERMKAEFLRHEKAMNHKPSAATLW